MSQRTYFNYDPAAIDRTAVYRLLTGAVVPRPIGWASTVSAAGVRISRRFLSSPSRASCHRWSRSQSRATQTAARAHVEEHPRDAGALRQRRDPAGVEANREFC